MKVYAMLRAGLVGSACISCIIVAAWQPYFVWVLSELHAFHVALLFSGDHALIEWALLTVDVIECYYVFFNFYRDQLRSFV